MTDNISFDALPYAVSQINSRLERIEELLTKLPSTPAPTKGKAITTKELCEALKVTEPTIIRWRNKGKIPFMRIGVSYRYDVEAVLKAIEETKTKKFT